MQNRKKIPKKPLPDLPCLKMLAPCCQPRKPSFPYRVMHDLVGLQLFAHVLINTISIAIDNMNFVGAYTFQFLKKRIMYAMVVGMRQYKEQRIVKLGRCLKQDEIGFIDVLRSAVLQRLTSGLVSTAPPGQIAGAFMPCHLN